ncbi:MAG: winged helix-turn-helix domain-containing protein [Alphaproteobacteria bacterium]|nr:winged helix-turn-helix domain-containing protein [Alphaproteobacteria bacterium]MDE2336021.1 winged helix-turn-helix domain-containing protein [Alphaproteobacteria bacterium]
MKEITKIFLLQIPPPVGEALREHLPVAAFEIVSAGAAAEADIVITGGAAAALPGRPVLSLFFAQPHRLGVLLRQIGRMLAEPVLYMEDIPVGGLLFKPREKLLARPQGADIPLTDREADILAFLARHAPLAVGREALLKNVWRYGEGVDTHTLETHIYRLRQKIEESAEAPRLLLTEAGGYRLHLAACAL